MIYIIAKVWQGGKFETMGAYKNEENARKEAAKLISFNEPFHVIIFVTQLKE